MCARVDPENLVVPSALKKCQVCRPSLFENVPQVQPLRPPAPLYRIQTDERLSPLQVNLRNEWAKAAEQADGAPFALLVGPCVGSDGLGVGEGHVGEGTCEWSVVMEDKY